MRLTSVIVLLALGAPALGQDVPEWIWDAPNERWVHVSDVRRFVSVEDGEAVRGGFAGERTERPAAAMAEQDVTLPGGMVRPRGRIVLSGTLDGLRSVEVAPDVGRGPPQEHTLARISFADGRAAVVDLGPMQGLEGVALAPGDRITVWAVTGHIDGQPVLMAESLRVAGRIREVDWSAGWRPRRPEPAAAPTSRSTLPPGTPADLSSGAGDQLVLHGRVRAVEEAGSKDIVQLTLEDGRRVVLGLRNGATLGALGIEQGDPIALRGRWGRLHDQRVFTLDAVRIDGEWRPVPAGP